MLDPLEDRVGKLRSRFRERTIARAGPVSGNIESVLAGELSDPSREKAAHDRLDMG